MYCFSSFFHLTYKRWTSTLPFWLWSLRIFPSLPGSRLMIFIAMQVQHSYNSATKDTHVLTLSATHGKNNADCDLTRIELTTSAFAAGTIPNSLYRVPSSYRFFLASTLCYCSFLLSLYLVLVLFCRCFSNIFPVQQTTYRIGNHVLQYYWVWLRPDRLM